MLKRTTSVAGVVLFLLAAVPAASPQTAAQVRESIEAIARGADTAARRQAITTQLQAAGIEFRLEDFVDPKMRQGTNIVATVPGKTPKTLLLGAHYDRVAQGAGVIDNGASCAVLIHLLKALKAKPLGHTVRVVFFDLEEVGLMGSRAYFEARRDEPLPEYAVNLDIFGYGNAIFATASKPDGPLAAALQKAESELKFPVRLSPPAQYPRSDHGNMIAAGIETVSLGLIDNSEIDPVLDILAQRSKTPPAILTLIHTDKDNLSALRIADIERAIPLVERMIRLVDVS